MNEVDIFSNLDSVVVLGDRILVKKERLDVGGLKMTVNMEADGEKNKGTVEAIGTGKQMKALRKQGLKVGSTVLFNRHFVPNHVEGEIPMVFVEHDQILAIL
jgi:co-chaperonin GroES (HSP10)